LDGIRVVDFGQYLAGPLVALFLADNGADVIHVDPPRGPLWDHPANAALYRNKRTLQLDLKSEVGCAEARRLVASADIVIEGFRPGVMARLGLEPQSCVHAYSRLIWCSLPGFPADDRRADLPAWEGIICAATGLYPRGVIFGPDPAFNTIPLASNAAAFMAAHRIAGALVARLRHGRGELIELSLYEACFQVLGQHAEVPPSRPAREVRRTFFERLRSLLDVHPTMDGRFVYFDTPLRGLQAFLDQYLPGNDLLEMDDAALHRLSKNLDELFASKTGMEWERIGQEEFHAAFGLVQTTEDWLHDLHALQSSTVVQVDDPEFGSTFQAGFPVRLSRTSPRMRWPRRACDPESGEKIEWLGDLREDPTIPAGRSGLPLDGFRVLDCASLLAGPTTTRILAQYGAEVVKVDRAGIATGDIDPLTDDVASFVGSRTVNAGKKMVLLDLKHASGQAIIRSIVKAVDIVHHNFTPGAAGRLGLDVAAVHQVNPTAILSTMSVHSHGGFRAEYRGHDMIAQMATGMSTRLGGESTPQVQPIVINDNAAGHLNAFGIMLALLHRNRTGEGQEVNASLSRTATMHQLPFMVGFAGRVWDEPAGPLSTGWHAIDRLYRGKDGWFYLAHGDRRFGRQLLEKSAREGAGILEGVSKVRDGDLEDWLASRFAELPVEESLAVLKTAGLGAHRYVSLADLLTDDDILERGFMTIVEHRGIGRAMGVGNPVLGSVDQTRPSQLAASRPGIDTIDVLSEYGFEAQVPQLVRERVIGVGENPILNTTTTRGYWSLAPTLSAHTENERLGPIVSKIRGGRSASRPSDPEPRPK
jgi:crotonobetainyl-CoA:carnitine CoA-transferase CaiB-like acyl-CoA transferase